VTPITYLLNGEHEIVLTAETEAAYDRDDPGIRARVEGLAQARANGTGRACEVFRSGGVDLLLAREPA
jgi:hypothetical protein